MIGTKTGGDDEISVPTELIDILRSHVRTQLRPGPQQESELLFPSEVGGYRSPSALDRGSLRQWGGSAVNKSKKPNFVGLFGTPVGAGEEIRTLDVHLRNVSLSILVNSRIQAQARRGFLP
jgi:hypothetical protein